VRLLHGPCADASHGSQTAPLAGPARAGDADAINSKVSWLLWFRLDLKRRPAQRPTPGTLTPTSCELLGFTGRYG
jgi:hypothetical protein